MNLFSRLSSDARHARRLREARSEIRRVERTAAERRRLPDPGYDELSDPLFIFVVLLALAVLVMDIRGDIDTSIIRESLRDGLAIVKGWL